MQKIILTLIVFFSASCSFFGGPDYDLSADSTGLSFDGIDDYIQIDANVIPDSGDFSIAVWGKADPKHTGNRIQLGTHFTLVQHRIQKKVDPLEWAKIGRS